MNGCLHYCTCRRPGHPIFVEDVPAVRKLIGGSRAKGLIFDSGAELNWDGCHDGQVCCNTCRKPFAKQPQVDFA